MDASYIPIAEARGFTTHWIRQEVRLLKKNMFFTNQVTYMHYTTGKKTRYITTKTLHVVQKLFI